MQSAVVNQVFSVPLRHLRSPYISNDQVLSESTVRGLMRYIGDCENELLRYLSVQQNLHDTAWPMLFFGPTGTGKTSLALTVVDQLVAEKTQIISMTDVDKTTLSPAIFSAPDFARRFHAAIETNSVSDFRSRITESHVLLIDNIHLLGDKPGVQQELIYLLDEMKEKGVPVVFTSLKSPLSGFCIGPLASRFMGGLSLELNVPGPLARYEILVELAKIHQIPIQPKAIEWLVGRFNTSVPKLNRFFNQLKSQIARSGDFSDLDQAFFESMFDLATTKSDQERTKTIIQKVAKTLQIKPSELKSNSRKQSVVRARGVAIYLCRTLLKTSFTKIGNSFGNRDHSTVMHAYNKIKNITESDSDSNLSKTITQLRDQLTELFSEQMEFDLPEENPLITS